MMGGGVHTFHAGPVPIPAPDDSLVELETWEDDPRPYISTAENVNPPKPGDPRYPDYSRRLALWDAWNQRQIAAMPPPPSVEAQPFYNGETHELETIALDPGPDAGQDPRSFEEQVEAFRSATWESDVGRPEPRPVSMQTRPPEADAFLVDRLARPGAIVLVAAPTGAGKSMVRTELEHRLAGAGGDLFGYYAVRGPLTVLTVDEDNGPIEEHRRDDATLAYLGLERQQLDRLYRVSYPGLLLELEESREWLRDRVLSLEADVLALDPVGHMYGVKEIREELQPVVNFLRQLQRDRPGLLVLVFHHTRKLQQGMAAGDRGIEDVRSGVWAEYADVVAILSPMGDRRAKWSVHKRVSPTTLILEQQPAGHWRYVADADSEDRRVSNDDRVLEAIDAGARAVDEIQIALELPERTIWNAVRRLRKQAILEPKGELRRRADAA